MASLITAQGWSQKGGGWRSGSREEKRHPTHNMNGLGVLVSCQGTFNKTEGTRPHTQHHKNQSFSPGSLPSFPHIPVPRSGASSSVFTGVQAHVHASPTHEALRPSEKNRDTDNTGDRRKPEVSAKKKRTCVASHCDTPMLSYLWMSVQSVSFGEP